MYVGINLQQWQEIEIHMFVKCPALEQLDNLTAQTTLYTKL